MQPYNDLSPYRTAYLNGEQVTSLARCLRFINKHTIQVDDTHLNVPATLRMSDGIAFVGQYLDDGFCRVTHFGH